MRKAKISALALVGALLSACGLDTNYAVPYDVQPGLIKSDSALQGVELTVGSKEFTENVILGYMAQYALSAAGARVQDLTGIQGTFSARQALTSAQVDLYWDYTGTGWLTFLGQDTPIPDQKKQYEAVRDQDLRENNLVWLPYSKLNDTYSFAAKASFAKENNVKSISDMVELIKKTPEKGRICLNGEFANRADGMKGVEAKYGFKAPENNLVNLTLGTTPSATGTACEFGVMNSTDGRIPANDLQVLEDDKEFFPKYNASVVLRKELTDQHPGIAKALNMVSSRLTNDIMQKLNEKVDVTGTPAEVVARDWMVEQGLITYNAAP